MACSATETPSETPAHDVDLLARFARLEAALDELLSLQRAHIPAPVRTTPEAVEDALIRNMEWVSADCAASLLGVTRRTVGNWCSEGKLVVSHPSATVARVSLPSIRKLLEDSITTPVGADAS